MDYKVSVIVPMYKAERFIEPAINGLLNQTLKELEVVVVNDCSPDNSLEICQRLFGDNERVQILTQSKNMGPGEARNTGIKAARGEYIAFADIDDGVLRNAYEELYSLAKENKDADVIHSTGNILPLDNSDPDDIYTVDEKYYLPIPNDRFDVATEVRVLSDDLNERYEKWKNHAYHWNLGTKLFRTQFLRDNDIHFGEIRLSEDMAFCFEALFLAKTYVLSPNKYYLYRISNVSISRRGYTTAFFKTSCHALFNVCSIVKRTMDKIDYFKENPKSMQGVFEYMLEILEQEFVIPVYQSLGEETILSDGLFTELMKEQFKDNADYMMYAFFEQHRKYPPTVSSMSQLTVDNVKAMMEKRKADSK